MLTFANTTLTNAGRSPAADSTQPLCTGNPYS